jgi:hypothetical protein
MGPTVDLDAVEWRKISWPLPGIDSRQSSPSIYHLSYHHEVLVLKNRAGPEFTPLTAINFEVLHLVEHNTV